jgi:hypothetical protein
MSTPDGYFVQCEEVKNLFKAKYLSEEQAAKAYLILMYSSLIGQQCPNVWELWLRCFRDPENEDFFEKLEKELDKLLRKYRKKYEKFEKNEEKYGIIRY